MSTLDADVAVVGAGPAGLAVAAACAGATLRVVVVDPDPLAVWPATYGVWEDELGPLGLTEHVRARWDGVWAHGTRPHHLPVPYALLDNARAADALRGRVTGADGRLVAARATGVRHHAWGSRLLVNDGSGPRALDVALVIDASGHRPVLARRPTSRAGAPGPAVQTAVGVVARFVRPPAPAGTCVLMDWRGPDDDDADPTFLYAMDLGDGTWLAEETSLARRPGLDEGELRRRLEQRLAASGAEPVEVVAREHVVIPMGTRPPCPDQAVVAFGAAGGLVHPATGYSVGSSLRRAPAVAREISAALERRAGTAGVVRAAQAAVWPGWRRRARHLEVFGLHALMRLRAGEARAFFDVFFDQPVERWHPYLAGELAPSGIARMMTGMFAATPWDVRARLAAGSPAPLWRAVTG